jgi:HEAT repeat protein
MIVRTLSKRWARDAVLDRFVEEFEAAPARWGTVGDNYAWALGNGIEIMAIDDDFDVLARLARDRRYRRAREMIVLGLGKSRRPEAVSTLLELVEDPDVDGHAILALAKIGSPRARSAFEAKLTDSRAWVRRAAARALRKLAPDD